MTLVLLLAGAWCIGAVFYSNLPGLALRVVAAVLFGLGWALALRAWFRRRPTLRWMLPVFVGVLSWYWLIPASNDRDWAPEMARMPSVDIDGDRLTVHNIRNSDYRSETDFDVRWETKVFDLGDIRTVDYIWSSWGVKDIVHTMISFGFEGGEYVVLSVMPRRERHELHTTAVGSLFKQYELIYVLAEECDVVRLRTNFRKENVYVFPTTATPAQARELFMAAVERINDLEQHPRYYNLVTQNCTTGLIPLLETIYPALPRWDWRYLLNADTMRMSFDNGRIASPLSFEQTLERRHANRYVEDHPECAGYSQRIRPDLESASAPR
jgi:hypothetical protein